MQRHQNTITFESTSEVLDIMVALESYLKTDNNAIASHNVGKLRYMLEDMDKAGCPR